MAAEMEESSTQEVLGPTRRTRRPVAQENERTSYAISSDTDASEKDDDEWEPEKKKPAVKKKTSAAALKVPKEPKVRKPRIAAKKSPGKKKSAAAPRQRKVVVKKVDDSDTTTTLHHIENAGHHEDDSVEGKASLKSIKEERLSMVIPENDLKSIQDGLKSEPVATPKKRTIAKKTVTPKPRKPKGAKMKKEDNFCNEEMPSTSGPFGIGGKEDEPGDDFTFGGPPQKKMKSDLHPEGLPVRRHFNSNKMLGESQMNWDLAQVLSDRTNVEMWVCVNIINLFHDENTIPFIARYRKELINNMDADALREMQQALEEQCTVAKKAHVAIQKMKKEGKLTNYLNTALLNCRTLDEVEYVYAPFRAGSKGTKAHRARQLGLEPAAIGLIETPAQLNLFSFIKPDVEGLTSLLEIQTGVQHILADMVAKDKDSLERIRKVCQHNYITLQSSLAKVTKDGPAKDVDKFHLYHNFTANVNRIQHHQILAINRGENLKILTGKINIPDRVKDDFCRWCVNERWRPKQYARPEFMSILRGSVEDSYKRLISPLLCREYRSKLTSDAEKESIMMFGRNLRQLLLAAPVRGRTIMGVDPGYKHGCKLAIISPTNQILHADVVYLHTGSLAYREAEKIRSLLINYKCNTVVIGNGSACRETERYFADLIQRRFFAPLDVVYCITNEAGASIYSVSPEASKEMPGLDPNLRSAVSIARRVQDPLAELVKIEPKHIGVGMYQHDVSQTLLKAALDSVVEECVSFVGVDINICSETLLRHIAGLNANRAKNIIDWRDKNGPFINREHLKSVKGLGPKSFQQCAGFIRINQEYIKNFCSNQQNALLAGDQMQGAGAGTKANAAGKPAKKKGKAAATASLQKPNPLDQTCIHPESYNVAQRFLTLINGLTSDIGKTAMQNLVNAIIRAEGIEAVAKKLQTTGPTLQLILDGLCQPEGYDLRTEFDKPDFKTNIVCIEDLKIGTVLTGKVENATLFGVFVDIGVGRAGLIPMRYITEAKLSKDKRRRSLGLGPGERVEVKVLSVDIRQSRITLELLRVL